jgi:methylmalonyl-CoA mutase N-terminal domain/subunit
VTQTVDPLGGSYFIEKLTDQVEEGARDYINRIDDMGGMIAAIKKGFPQQEIQEASYEYQKSIEAKQRIVVGVNDFLTEEDSPTEILQIGEETREKQSQQIEALKSRRDQKEVQASLQRLKNTAQSEDNLFPSILEAVRCYATLGEICGALKEEFGEYVEPAF